MAHAVDRQGMGLLGEAGASQVLSTVRCWCLLEAASSAELAAGAGPLFKPAHDILLIRMPGSTQLL